LVQGVAGFAAGVSIGLVPGGAVGEQVLTATKVLAEGTRAAQVGKSLGEMVGGALTTVGGAGGELVGGAASSTGLGAVVGVPAMVVSAGVVTGGIGNMAAGVHGLSAALMMKGGETSETSKGTPSPNLSPKGAGRQGALNEAKRQNNVPTSQQPERVQPNADRKGTTQPGRQYQFRDVNGKKVIIRDDAAGHDYGPDDPQNRGPHFNDADGNHYDY
jgi:HNH/Endo VII superfamily nuclease toxins